MHWSFFILYIILSPSSFFGCHTVGTLATVPGDRHHGSFSPGEGWSWWTGRETPAYDVKGVQTHTQEERERERTSNQTDWLTISIPHGHWREAEISTYHLVSQPSQGEICLFLFIAYYLSRKKTRGGSVRGERKKTTSWSRKTRSCRIKERRWMLLVLLSGGCRPNLLQDSQTLVETNELNNWALISK